MNKIQLLEELVNQLEIIKTGTALVEDVPEEEKNINLDQIQ